MGLADVHWEECHEECRQNPDRSVETPADEVGDHNHGDAEARGDRPRDQDERCRVRCVDALWRRPVEELSVGKVGEITELYLDVVGPKEICWRERGPLRHFDRTLDDYPFVRV